MRKFDLQDKVFAGGMAASGITPIVSLAMGTTDINLIFGLPVSMLLVTFVSTFAIGSGMVDQDKLSLLFKPKQRALTNRMKSLVHDIDLIVRATGDSAAKDVLSSAEYYLSSKQYDKLEALHVDLTLPIESTKQLRAIQAPSSMPQVKELKLLIAKEVHVVLDKRQKELEGRVNEEIKTLTILSNTDN